MCSIITTALVVFVLLFGFHSCYLLSASQSIANKTVDRDFKGWPEYDYFKKLEATIPLNICRVDLINNEIIFCKLDTYNLLCPTLINPPNFTQSDPYSYFMPFKVKVCL